MVTIQAIPITVRLSLTMMIGSFTTAGLLITEQALAECDTQIHIPAQEDRFKSDGAIVRDTHTGITWQRCIHGMQWNSEQQSCVEDDNVNETEGANNLARKYSWFDAQTLAASINQTGIRSVRLPNKKELASIVNFSCTRPAIDNHVFPNTPQGLHWSSTPVIYSSTSKAWGVDFTSGEFVARGIETQGHIRFIRLSD